MNREKKSVKYWSSIKMDENLASIIIFSMYFGLKYEKDREVAENNLWHKGVGEFTYKNKRYSFGGVSYEKIDERNMSHFTVGKVMAKQAFKLKSTRIV